MLKTVLLPKIVVFALLAYFTGILTSFGQARFYSNFESGNGELSFFLPQQNLAVLTAQKRKGDVYAIWFFGRLEGYRKDTLLTIGLRSQATDYLMPDPLVYSYDSLQWHRAPAQYDKANKQRTYQIPKNAQSQKVYLAAGYPYTYSQMWKELRNLETEKRINLSDLCTSEGGNAVPLVVLGAEEKKAKGAIWLTGRLHAFESPGSHMLMAFLKHLASDAPEARWLRSRYRFYIAPMMDVDQVILGGSGKDQKPADFNRDWLGTSHYTAINAYKALLLATEERLPTLIYLDSHSPFPFSNMGSHFYAEYKDVPEKKAKFEKFRQHFADLEGYLPHVNWNNNQFGKEPVSARTYFDNTFPNSAADTPKLKQLHFSITFEQAFQNSRQPEDDFNIPRLEKAGQNLMLTFYRYFR